MEAVCIWCQTSDHSQALRRSSSLAALAQLDHCFISLFFLIEAHFQLTLATNSPTTQGVSVRACNTEERLKQSALIYERPLECQFGLTTLFIEQSLPRKPISQVDSAVTAHVSLASPSPRYYITDPFHGRTRTMTLVFPAFPVSFSCYYLRSFFTAFLPFSSSPYPPPSFTHIPPIDLIVTFHRFTC